MKRILLLALCALTLHAQTAIYPGGAATDQDLLVAKDRSSSTLSTSINNSTLTVIVASGTSFIAKELITIDNEQMIICSISTNTFTICTGTRGYGGTSAASHTSGVAVRGNVAAYHHNALKAEIKAIETRLVTGDPGSLSWSIDGGGIAITTGNTTCAAVPTAATITGWIISASPSGSIAFGVWKTAYSASTDPTISDSIVASAPPTLTTNKRARSSTLTSWTTSIAADDILCFTVTSATTVTKATVALKVTRQ